MGLNTRWISVGTSGKAAYSDNDGAAWTGFVGPTIPGVGIKSIRISKTNPNIISFATYQFGYGGYAGNHVFISFDGGLNWFDRKPTDFGHYNYTQFVSHTMSDDGKYINVFTDENSAGYMYRSTDSGLTWGYGDYFSGADRFFCSAGSTSGRDVIGGGQRHSWHNTGGYFSNNYGASFWRGFVHASVHAASMSYDGSKALLGASWSSYGYEGVWYVKNWSPTKVHTTEPSRCAISGNGNVLFILVGSFLNISENEGASWTVLDPLGDGLAHSFSALSISEDGHTMIAGIDGKLYRTEDKGSTWSEIQPKGAGTFSWNESEMSATGQHIIVREGSFNIYKSDDYGATWTQIAGQYSINTGDYNVKFGSSSVKSIAHGNNMWLAVGEDGKASYSYDNGSHWTALPYGTTTTGLKFDMSDANSVAFGGDKFIAVGSFGKASYSYNGIDWYPLNLYFGDSNIYKVVYCNNTWLAVGGDGKAAYSTDGLVWTYLTPGASTGLKIGGIAALDAYYGNGTWVVVAEDGGYSYSTNNCVSWTAGYLGTDVDRNTVYYYNGKWMTGSADGKIHSVSFPATTQTLIGDFGAPVNSIKCLRDKWVIVGNDNYAVMDADGTGYTAYYSTTVGNLCVDGDKHERRFVVGGQNGQASITKDGKTWTALNGPETEGIKMGTSFVYAACATDRSIVVAGADGKGSYSEDGINWKVLTPGVNTGLRFDTSTINAIAYEPTSGYMAAVGQAGKWSYSANFGQSWYWGDPDEIYFDGDNIHDIATGNGKGIAVGAFGKASIFDTTTGLWTSLPAGVSTGIKFGTTDSADSVAYGKGTWVVVGANGKASYSTDDGTTWTVLTPGASTGIKFDTNRAQAVAFGGDKFVVVGNSGKASYSYNGIDWNAITIGSSALFNVAYYNGVWITAGADDATYYSDDGITWSVIDIKFTAVTGVIGLSPVPNFRKNLLRRYTTNSALWRPSKLNVSLFAWNASAAYLKRSVDLTGFDKQLVFSSDGYNLYYVGDGTLIHQYSMSIPWDITTAVSAGTFDVSAKETSPQSMAISPDGSKIYICGRSTRALHRYTLNTPWAISSASFHSSTGTLFGATLLRSNIYFRSDGLMVYIFFSSTSTNYVSQYSLSVAWNISTLVSVYNYAPSATIYALHFTSDGHNMFLLTNKGIIRYWLRIPWDVSTSFVVDTTRHTNNFATLIFSSDGKTMYINTSAGVLGEWSLSSKTNIIPWDVEALVEKDIYVINNIQDLKRCALCKEGTKAYYATARTTTAKIYQYFIPSPYQIDKQSYEKELSLVIPDANYIQGIGMIISETGLRMYVCLPYTDLIYQFNLSSAWDISTATLFDTLNVSSQESSVQGMFFRPNGRELYIIGGAGKISHYGLSSAWEITTATLIDDLVTGFSNGREIFFSPDGTKMYTGSQWIYQYELSTAWDISTAVYIKTSFYISALSNIFITPDGLDWYIFEGMSRHTRYYSSRNTGSIKQTKLKYYHDSDWMITDTTGGV